MEIRFDFSRKEWIYPLAILILGFFYYISYFDYGINLSDEGFLVYGAERVLKGQLPMSDFFSYTPGSYFLLASLFKMLGANLLVSRSMEIAFLLLNGVMMFYVSKRLMPSHWALIPTFLLVLFPGPWFKVFFTFGLLLPLLTLFRFLEKRTTMRVFSVGWAVGGALILKLESGLFSLLTVWIVLFLSRTLEAGKPSFDRKTILGFLKDLLLCSLAICSVFTPFFLYYLSKSSLAKALFLPKGTSLFGNIGEIAQLYGEQPSLLKAITRFRVGNLKHLFFFLIVLLYLYALGKVIVHLFFGKGKGFPVSLPVLIMGILSLTYVYIPFGKSHLFQSVTMAYILFGSVMYSFAQRRGTRSRVVITLLLLLLGLYFWDNLNMKDYFNSGSIQIRYAIKKEGAELLPSNKAKLYVGKRQFDVVNSLIRFFEGKDGYLTPLYCDPMVNFLTGLENPTPFSIILPGFIRNVAGQQRVINELERYQIKYLLGNKVFFVRGDSLRLNILAPLLYEWIMKNYRLEKEIEGYLIFSRK